jgi:hypothetical protein
VPVIVENENAVFIVFGIEGNSGIQRRQPYLLQPYILTDAGVRLLNKLRPATGQITGLVPADGTGDTFSQPRRGSRVNCRTERGWVSI